ncbi:hypothetical protein EOG37_01185 [Clavibacter michiganensis subsp. michiganensis]|uniref:hypothetical protein n=1 Tax=Clavibacter michiganensis TaxID=28447 RepID=UPI001C651A7E|nr:hypothetical protein [Clavibacter michiganensis]MBW8025295.1 hypothetical protein [Clavibacter michiganensis subsp. michiganensis]
MITPTDLSIVSEDIAWRMIGVARSFAPKLDDLEGTDRTIAIAILKGVAAEAKARGSRHIDAQRIGSASIDYASVSSWFYPDDRDALRALGGGPSTTSGPVGSFPKPGIVAKIWPEE